MAYLRISALLLLSILLAAPSTALAGSIPVGGSERWSYSTGACSSCSASVLFELLTGSTLRVTFENNSTDSVGGQNVFTGIGFDTTSTLESLSILSQSVEGGKTWALGNGIGGGNWQVGLRSTRGINNGLDNQSPLLNSGTMILSWQNSLPLSLFIQAGVTKFQAVGPLGNSINALGAAESAAALNPTPEPGTLLLIGGGGALLAALNRRRLRARAD